MSGETGSGIMNNSERLDAIIAKALGAYFNTTTHARVGPATEAVRDALLAEGRVLYEGDACKASLVIPLDAVPVVSPRPNRYADDYTP